MGRKSIPILLKATSPETKTFTSIGEAPNPTQINMEKQQSIITTKN